MCFGATLAVLCWRQGLTARRPSLMGGGFLAGMAMLAASTAIWLSPSKPFVPGPLKIRCQSSVPVEVYLTVKASTFWSAVL